MAKFCSPARRQGTGAGPTTCLRESEISYTYRRVFGEEGQELGTSQKWLRLKKHYQRDCGENEFCWLDRVADGPEDQPCSILRKAFVPDGPWKGRKWLSGRDIELTMRQYQDLYEDFLFLGVWPRDFQWVADHLYYGEPGLIRTTDLLEAYRSGTRRMATVLNTDKHDGPGQHWHAIFIDMTPAGTREDPWTFEHFDSIGNGPRRRVERETLEWANTFSIIAVLGLSKHVRFMYNGVVHQKGSDACGVFSCYFITNRLSGVPFIQHCQDVRTDAEMTEKRAFFFRPKPDER